MAPWRLRLALPLLLVLLPAGLGWLFASCSSPHFVARHVDFPRSCPPPGQHYCDYLMRQWRSLNGTWRHSITFVHSGPSQLSGLCCCGPTRICVSRDPLPTTTCRMAFGGSFGGYMCWSQRRRIRVACHGKKPMDILGTV